MGKYYSADITWCNCGCGNKDCPCHICHLDPLKGSGYYSQADYSDKCPNYKPKGVKKSDVSQ